MTAPFTSQQLAPAYQRQLLDQALWQQDCPIALERLRCVNVSYYDFAGKPQHDGQLIVLDAIANATLALFRELYRLRFAIERIRPSSAYHGDDQRSMQANNTSCFNQRLIADGSKLSLHAYGVAIDINPQQNPCFETKPSATEPFANRQFCRPGMAEPVVGVFKAHGFSVWGGHWQHPIDYHHFQPSRLVAQLLAAMQPSDAQSFFNVTIAEPHLTERLTLSHYDALIHQYQQQPKQFIQALQQQLTAVAV